MLTTQLSFLSIPVRPQVNEEMIRKTDQRTFAKVKTNLCFEKFQAVVKIMILDKRVEPLFVGLNSELSKGVF